MFKLNFLHFLSVATCPVSEHHWEESDSVFFTPFIRYLHIFIRFPWAFSSRNLAASPCLSDILIPWSCWEVDHLQHVHISALLGSLKLDVKLQMRLLCWAEVAKSLLQSSGKNFPNAAQGAVDCLCCTSTMLTHGQFFVQWDSCVLFCKACQFSANASASPGAGHGFPFAELDKIPLCPLSQPSQLLVISSTTACCSSRSS